jgi:hypothetical protein
VKLGGRDLAALILAAAFGVAVVGVVLGVYIPAVRFSGPGLSTAGLDVLLTIVGALIGAVGAALSHELHGARARVGVILAATLAAVVLVVAGFVLWDATQSSTPAISSNTGKVLATTIGGMLGALLGYLGLAAPGTVGAPASSSSDSSSDSGSVDELPPPASSSSSSDEQPA